MQVESEVAHHTAALSQLEKEFANSSAGGGLAPAAAMDVQALFGELLAGADPTFAAAAAAKLQAILGQQASASSAAAQPFAAAPPPACSQPPASGFATHLAEPMSMQGPAGSCSAGEQPAVDVQTTMPEPLLGSAGSFGGCPTVSSRVVFGPSASTVFRMDEEEEEEEVEEDPYLHDQGRAASDGELGFRPARGGKARRIRGKTRVLGPLPLPGRRLRISGKAPPEAPPTASIRR